MPRVYTRKAHTRHSAHERECESCGQAFAEQQRLKKYGLTPAGYAALAFSQGGVCAICRSPETQPAKSGGKSSLSVDHDHKTGRVRGLLCKACNAGLGRFRDDPFLLGNAADYLGVKLA